MSDIEIGLAIYLCAIIIIFLTSLKDFNNVDVTTAAIYECNDLNWLGCIVIFVIALIINPIFFFCHFIYWIFHVGREE